MDETTGSGSDRRGHPRTGIELNVEYKKLNTFFHDYTKNISRGGTFIKTPKPLEVGTEFVFKLRVPELLEPLSLRGQVKWVVSEQDVGKDPEKPEAGMGIQFLYESEEDRLRVEATVERLMKKHLGEVAVSKLINKP
jgi:type IV pilus assembly protein PilZ